MKRDEVVQQLYGKLSAWEENDLICQMNREMDSFADDVAKTTGLHKYEGYYYFLGRMGENYRQYPFSWEPFRDFAGPLLRGRASLPIVLISSDTEPDKPNVEIVQVPRPHYQVKISPTCSAFDIALVWLELLADNEAIPREGGEERYSWFFKGLGISPMDLSEKARSFVNRF